MNTVNESLWRRAMNEFDALVDLAPLERDAALALLAMESAELVQCVLGLLDTDARAGDDARISQAAAAQDTPKSQWPRIAGFRVLGLLGRGGMGEVFLAERATDDFVQRVALKRMALGKHDASLHERFLRERRILAQLNHSNIARLLDGGLDADGNPYFAMEFVEGVSLTQYARDHALDLSTRLRLFVVVCEAVAFAQANLIVHRDIKPSNVLVNATGQVKLLDFGIAKLLAPGDSEATATLVMTPAYAAPEQLLGEAISTATDVYALGVLLFELLVGHLPERSWRERMHDAVTEQNSIQRPSLSVLSVPSAESATTSVDARQRRRLAQQLRGDLDQIVLLALRRDPARRYATAQALADDLTRFLDGRPVRARADHWRYRLEKFVRRNAWAMAAAALTFSGLIAATVVSLSFASRERVARAAADSERSKAEQQAQRATRTKDFVVALFADVDPLKAAGGKGNDYSAVELLDAAALRVDTDLGDVPEAQAELRYALAESLRNLGRPQAALSLLDAAIPQLRDLGSGGHRTLSSALQSRAQAREQLSDLSGAEADAREALDIAMALPDDQEARLGRIRIRTSLANQLTLRNKNSEALSLYQAILKERTAFLGRDDAAGLAVDWSNLSSIYERLQRFDEAEFSARRAMQLFAAENGSQHPRMAWLHNGLGFALLGLDRLDEAEEEFQTARTLARAKLDANNSILLNIHVGLGRTAQARGDYTAADAAFAEARRIGTVLNHTSLGVVEVRTGLLLLQEQRFAEAEAMLRRGIERSKKLGATLPDPLVLHGTVARGLALARIGRVVEGEALAVAALAKLATVVDKRTPRYLESVRLLEELRQPSSIESR
jgi:eukaryotic-like serine/threonine-protein kinase